jgi:SGNH hydrolase-like domain, acetyltransferase AlgX
LNKLSQLPARQVALWLIPLALLVALLIAECVLRLFPQLLPEEAQVKLLYRLQSHAKSIGDPYLGFVYPPRYQAEMTSLDFRFEIDSDEHGFRNKAPWPERADIVIVGDSMAYGWGVQRNASWMTLLDAQLPENRTITLGMPGAVPQQYVRYLERFGVGLHPKMVLFAIFPGNDIIDAETFNRWVAAGSPGNYDFWRHFGGDAPNSKAAFPRNSYLFIFLRAMAIGVGQQYGSRTVKTANGGKLQLAPTIYRQMLPRNVPTDPGFQSVVQATLAARNLALSAGSEFLVLLFPTKESIYLPLHGVHFPTMTHPLKDMLENEGISCIDLTESFREHAGRGEKLYFEIDGHPNEHGNRVIADAVAQRLTHLQQSQAGS